MYLTSEEEKMLSGEYGGLVQESMKLLVKIGEAHGAERMINIKYANTGIGVAFMMMPNGRQLVEEAVKKGFKTKVPATLGQDLVDYENWELMKISKEFVTNCRWIMEMSKKMGMIPALSCAPYEIAGMDWYPLGSSISSVESSAVAYFNSVMGARTNRDFAASFFAAVTGKYPEFGYHLDENRRGTHLFETKVELKDKTDYSALGYYAGKIVGLDVPVFEGIKTPKTDDLKLLTASAAVGGAVTLCHVVGVTPEARTSNMAFGNDAPKEKITVTTREIKATYEELSTDTEGNVDFVWLGCPHASIYEIQKIAWLLKGKKIHKDVTLWITTSPFTKSLAESMGYVNEIRHAGGVIICGTCPILSGGCPGPTYAYAHPEYSIGNCAVDSAKAAYYVKPLLNASKVFFGSMERCIDAAITSKWE